MTEHRLALPGLELAAVEHGAATAPPLLALHGWLDNAASFAPLAAALGDRQRLIALDLPGHGRSDGLPAGALWRYRMDDYVGIVLAAMDALSLPTAALLGHSLGAGIASLIAAAAPQRVSRLALIEGLGPLADDGDDTLQRWRRAWHPRHREDSDRRRRFDDLDAAVAARSAAGTLAPAHARGIVERGTCDDDGGLRWRSDPRLTRPTPLRMAETQVRALLAGIACPAWLLLATPHTTYLPPALITPRAACVADLHVEHMAGGHHLHLERPQAVATRLHAFLAR